MHGPGAVKGIIADSFFHPNIRQKNKNHADLLVVLFIGKRIHWPLAKNKLMFYATFNSQVRSWRGSRRENRIFEGKRSPWKVGGNEEDL
jgi:hypothetical protein